MSARTAHAYWIVAPGRGELRPALVPDPGPQEVQLRALYSGVSRGTESLVFHGRVPESEVDRMRAPHQDGSLRLPVKYGYGLVAEVIEGVEPGRTVFCLHPHQTFACVDADAVRTVPVDVPPARAVLAANMETAVNAVWDGAVSLGDRVVVIGGGVVGCLVAYLCGRMPGVDVQLVDLDERRSAVASALGVQFSTHDVWAGADVVFHASASGSGLQTALEAAGDDARVVELSWYGDRAVSVELGTRFHPGRVQLISSQVGRLPPQRTPRWTYGRRLDVALGLLRDDALDVLISGESAFEDMPAAMRQVLAPPSPNEAPVLCHRICY